MLKLGWKKKKNVNTILRKWTKVISSSASSIMILKLNPVFALRCVAFQEHHEDDLFLYLTYSNESVYGA